MSALRLLLACAGLAFALTFDNAWPGLGVMPQPDVSVEALAMVALSIALFARAPDALAARRRLTWMATALAVLVILHYVNVTVPALFGRPFNLFWDGRHLPRVAVMAATNSSGWLVAAAVSAIVLALWLLHAACRWALRTVATAATNSGQAQRIAAALAGAAVLTAAFGAFGPSPQRDHVVTPLAYTYGKQLLFVAAVHTPGATDRLLGASPAFEGNLSALRGADVMILFSESYGVSTFEDRALSEALRPARELLGKAVADTGRHSASAYVMSPTFGGGSWLAHAALLSGVDMREADHHALLLASKRPSLVGHFKRHGYRSVALMPGLQSEWPEGGYYAYDELYDARALGYRGPEFGFWRIPDQYSIGRLHRLEQQQLRGAPRLIVFPTITSHLPFDPVPPLASDWRFAREGAPDSAFEAALDAAAVRETLTRPLDWTALREPYVRSMDYSLRWLSGYLRELAPRDLLLVVIGDHQPAATVVGRDADRAVPVHVLSTSAELVRRFVDAGFTAGLTPRRPALGQMHELTPMLLRVFDGCDNAAAGSAVSGGRAASGTREGSVDCEPARVDIPGARPGG